MQSFLLAPRQARASCPRENPLDQQPSDYKKINYDIPYFTPSQAPQNMRTNV
jgi:hypothetical protein